MCAIYKKKVSVGAFLEKGKDIKDGDIVEVANEGKEVEGQFGMQNIFLVKTKDKEGNVSFNQTSMNNMIDGFGEDSLKWVGQKVRVWAILSNVQGKMIKVYYFSHPTAEIGEDGSFSIPGKQKTADEQLDEMAGEQGEVVNPEDIPY